MVTVAIVVAGPTILAARGLSSHGPIDWVPYTPERFTESVSAGDVVVMDFTAEWCLNCKVLESAVLHRESVVRLFDLPGVVPMRVDLTTDNPSGQAKLKELGWVGIPLLAVFGPGTGYESPILHDSYTTGTVRDAVVRATGVIER
jgi:thiol:disulfide interchange protein